MRQATLQAVQTAGSFQRDEGLVPAPLAQTRAVQQAVLCSALQVRAGGRSVKQAF
jgi:predicted alternative tryptophan synthase beta-subunit